MSTATLKSIAEATGYSITTVSRALGGFDDVNERTRQIILQEAKRQNYQPNLSARKLKGQRSQTIGLVIPSGSPPYYDPFFTALIAGVGNRAAADKFKLLLSTQAPGGDAELNAYRQMITGHSVDGVVIVRVRQDDPRIALLQQRGIPFVVFGRSANHHNYTHIDIDGHKAQRVLTEHLIEQGHTKIAYIVPPKTLTFSQYRLDGFREAMAAHNIPVREDWLLTDYALTEEAGREAAKTFMDMPNAPTAIMTGNDLTAMGVMALLHERGLEIGKDVAVAGFDDISTAAHVYPGLTTMHQPIHDIGERLGDMLLNTITNGAGKQNSVILDAELVVRGSTLKVARQ